MTEIQPRVSWWRRRCPPTTKGEVRSWQEGMKTALDAVTDAISIIDVKSYKILGGNKRFFEQLGLEEGRAVGKTCHEMTHGLAEPCGPPHHPCPIQGLLEGGEPAKEEHMHTINGKERVVEVSAYPVYENGELEQVVHVSRDITQRKRAEEEKALLLTVTRAMAEAPSFNTALETALRKVVEATGWDYGEAWVPGKGALELSPAYHAARRGLKRFRRESEGFVFPPGVGLPGRVWVKGEPEWLTDASAERELFLRHRIARETGLRAAFAVPISTGGEVLAVLAFFMSEAREEDSRLVKLVSAVASQLGTVVKRRRAEKELREKKEYIAVVSELDRLIGSSLDIDEVYGAFAGGVKNLVDYDRISVALYDEDRGELTVHLACSPEGCILPRGRVPVEGTVLGEVVKAGRGRLFGNMREEFPGDENFTAEGFRSCMAVPLVSPSGTIGTFSVAKRRSNAFTEGELKILEDLGVQLAIAVENSRLYELKSNIIANVSHELRTPATIVRSVMELMRMESTSDTWGWYLDKVCDALERQDTIVENLIETASFDWGGGGSMSEEVDVKAAIELARERVGERAPTVEVGCEKNIPTVRGSRRRLVHVLRNLLNNAIKFSEGDAEVSITARERKDGMVELCVSDNGIGIPQEVQGKIFDRLYQVDGTATRRYGGTGMGLAIVKEAVEALGGEVGVESEVGKGSTFCISLPPARRRDDG